MNSFKIIFILLFLSNSVYSQQMDVCGQVNYTQVFVLDAKVVEEYVMKFNDVESYYSQTNVLKTADDYKEIDGNKSTSKITVIGKQNLTPKFYYNGKSNFYFQDNFADQILLVKEDDFNWDWKITNKTKKIGNFLCYKATTNFRGRKYTAWFTKQVPVSFGPWKFNGLPGLILEITDSKGIVTIVATKIAAGKDINCQIDVDQNNLNTAISIAEYRKQKEDLIDGFFAKLSSKLQKGSDALIRNKNCDDCGSEVEIFH